MLKAIPGSETMIHECDQKLMSKQIMSIRLHDTHPFAILPELQIRTEVKQIWLGTISYCPYCGVDIEKEDRP